MKNKIEAYKEILQVLEKHKDLVVSDRDINILTNIKIRILHLSVLEQFQINVTCNPSNDYEDWIKIDEFTRLGLYGKFINRGISWEDDGKKPEENEWLYILSFPSGAYLFGKDYPVELFDRFFEVLKSYSPKYIDSRNHALYFDHTNAKNIHADFYQIYKNYQQLYQEENKEKLEKIKQLEEQLNKLKNN